MAGFTNADSMLAGALDLRSRLEPEVLLFSSIECALLFGVAIVVTSCGKGPLRVDGEPPGFDANVMVTDTVARLLDANGQVPSQQASVPGAIGVDHARGLAERYIRLFGPTVRTWLEGLHGGPIDFARLHADQRVLLSESPFELLEANVPSPERKRAGPYYLVTLRDRVLPVVTVAVSALSSDIAVDSIAVRTSASERGDDFLVWPIPRGGPATPALSPEQAIAVAFAAFGRPVDALPSYERRGIEYFPHEGAWRISLAEPVSVVLRKDNRRLTTRVIYVEDATTFAVPTIGQLGAREKLLGRGSRKGISWALRYRANAAETLAEVRPLTSR